MTVTQVSAFGALLLFHSEIEVNTNRKGWAPSLAFSFTALGAVFMSEDVQLLQMSCPLKETCRTQLTLTQWRISA